MKRFGALITVLTVCLLWVGSAFALKSHKATVWAHGMGGFDSIWYVLDSWYYWGDDTGASVIDSCGTLEAHCNDDIYSTQWGFHDDVIGFETSEVRGLALANQIQNFMVYGDGCSGYQWEDVNNNWAGCYLSDEANQTDFGLNRGDKVHIIGHSQGGMDARKAAKELYARSFNIYYEHRYLQSEWIGTFSYTQTRAKNLGANTIKVDHIVSMQSPHRGSTIANEVLTGMKYVTFLNDVLDAFMDFCGFWNADNNSENSMRALTWSGYSQSASTFNSNYPGTDGLYARKHISFLGAQKNMLNYYLNWAMEAIIGDINGFIYNTSSNNGDGVTVDDDGFVGVASARMGYQKCWSGGLTITDSGTGFTNLNSPTSTQMTSMTCVLNADHADTISVPEDSSDGPEWDEMKWAAAVVNYLDANEEHINYYNFDGHYGRDDAHNY